MGAEHVLPDRLEPDSTRPRLLLAIAGAVLLLLVIAFGLVLWFYTANVPPHGPLTPQSFPAPRLMHDETDWLNRAQTEQRARLEGWRWVDHDKGVIAIPIAEAMHRIAAKGANGYAPIDDGSEP